MFSDYIIALEGDSHFSTNVEKTLKIYASRLALFQHLPHLSIQACKLNEA